MADCFKDGLPIIRFYQQGLCKSFGIKLLVHKIKVDSLKKIAATYVHIFCEWNNICIMSLVMDRIKDGRQPGLCAGKFEYIVISYIME